MSMLIMKKEKLHEFVKKSVIFPPVKISKSKFCLTSALQGYILYRIGLANLMNSSIVWCGGGGSD